jgi:TRAP-type mannitol/chloroaromatic compound transport system permease small subunit
VEATQLGMGIGSAPEGANLGTSAEALGSGNGPTGINTLYGTWHRRVARAVDFLSTAMVVYLIPTHSLCIIRTLKEALLSKRIVPIPYSAGEIRLYNVEAYITHTVCGGVLDER